MRADKRQSWAEPEDWTTGRHTSPYRVVRRPVAVVVLLIGLIVAAGGTAGLIAAGRTGHAAVPLGKTPIVAVPAGRIAPAPEPTAGAAVSPPVRLIIPKIGVTTRLIRLGVTKNHELQPPSTTSVAGWFTGGPPPGAIGPAVIGGHIDSKLGVGVFFRLRELRRGDRVFVRHRNRTLSVFAVDSVHQYLKDKFPTEAVYGPTFDAALRLITCGGTFDYSTGHYLSNVVVFATLLTSRAAR